MKHENHSEGTPFSLICDETSDTSRHEQFSLCVSYIGSSGMKTETFICFIKVKETDAASLYNVVCSSLEKLGLDPINVVGLAVDGAANMSGVHTGLAVRMKAVSPLSIYLHCMGHQLNLTVKDTVTPVKSYG